MSDELDPKKLRHQSMPRQTVRGAVYLDGQSGERLRLLRLGGTRVLVENVFEEEGRAFYMETADFAERFELTEDHDHENYCCLVHHSHVNPHRGCILR